MDFAGVEGLVDCGAACNSNKDCVAFLHANNKCSLAKVETVMVVVVGSTNPPILPVFWCWYRDTSSLDIIVF